MLEIEYPEHFPDIRTLTGKAHDLDKRLYNATPKTDWKQGDYAWVYAQKERKIICGIITRIHSDNYASIRDVQPNGYPSDGGAWLTELFPTLDALNRTLFGLDPEGQEET